MVRREVGTQEHVAELLGVTTRTIQRRETGALAISKEAWIALYALAKADSYKDSRKPVDQSHDRRIRAHYALYDCEIDDYKATAKRSRAALRAIRWKQRWEQASRELIIRQHAIVAHYGVASPEFNAISEEINKAREKLSAEMSDWQPHRLGR